MDDDDPEDEIVDEEAFFGVKDVSVNRSAIKTLWMFDAFTANEREALKDYITIATYRRTSNKYELIRRKLRFP